MDNRKYPREVIDPVEMVFEEVQAETETYKHLSVHIEEVSYEGIRFQCEIEFSVQDNLFFRMPSLEIGSLIEGKVIWKKKLADQRYQYGLFITNSGFDGEFN